MSLATRWAILLCRYSDDANDPATTTIQQLASQNVGAPWVTPSWQTNANTILWEYQRFFTLAGAGTFNMPAFFSAMSHGTVGLGAEVFPVQLPRTLAEATQLATVTKPGTAFQEDTFKLAKKAWVDQWGAVPKQFYAVVVSFQSPDWGSQGGSYDGGPGVYMDIRYVVNNGSKRWGHEMGHAFGLDHSRADTDDPTFNPAGCLSGPPDYRDPWDTMSAECSFGTPDPDYGAAGPGLNAWNMRTRGWLDETRVWHAPKEIFSQVLTLRPLHRMDLPGFLAVELPPPKATNDFPRYLIEFRLRSDWDAGIARSCVQVHRQDGSVGEFGGTHSYLQFSLSDTPDMVAGDIFAPSAASKDPRPVMRVLAIDDKAATAFVRASYLPDFLGACAARNQDGRLEVFCIAADNTVHHLWQVAPNGAWTTQFPKIGKNDLAKQIAMILNANAELEIFYVGTDDHIYNNWQIVPNGNWHGEVRVSDDTYAKQVAVGVNADGTTQIFYRGTNDRLYYDVKKTGGGWHGEKKLGDAVERVVVERNQSGQFELCFVGGDGKLYRRRQMHANDYDSWGPITSLGASASDVAIAQCSDLRLELVFVDSNGEVSHFVQDAINGAWGQPQRIFGFATRLAICTNAAGLLELFFTDNNQVLMHARQTALHQWERTATAFQGAAKQVMLVANQDSRLELIYVGTDDALYHNWQIGTTNNWNGEMPF